MKKHFDAVFVGMINFDISVPDFHKEMCSQKQSYVSDIHLGAGGDAQNCAICLSKMGYRAALCGRIGRDIQGEILEQNLENAGVSRDYLIRSEQSTGTVVSLIQDKESSFVACQGANAALKDSDVSEKVLDSTNIICINSLFGCGEISAVTLEKAKRRGILTVADTNNIPDAKLEEIVPQLRHLDYFLPSAAEAFRLSATKDPVDAARAFLEIGARNVIIKLGGKGCYCATEEFVGYVDGFSVEPVDLTGCGDNFVAGFLAGLIEGYGIRESVILANAAGALTAAHLGASGAVYSFEQLQQFSRLK